MSQIQTTRLPDICLLVTDGTHDSPKLQSIGIPFIKGKHISSGRIDFESCDFISEEDHKKCIKRVKPQPGDVLFANIGSVGDVALVMDETEFSIKNVALFRPNPEKVDPSYFYYLVLSPSFRGVFLNVRSGAAQPFISLEAFRQHKFLFNADMTQQARIGDMLSAYDDLIENNRRRIALLEESVRLLYREWFVYLRFPGYEHTRIINGVPEGWERKRLGDVIELKYGKALKESDRIEGPFPVYGSSGIVGTHNEALVKGPAIIVGRKGNVGSVYWSEKDCNPIDTVYFIESDQCTFFLFHNLQHQNFVSSDAAVPGLNRKYAYSLPIILPSRTIHTQFEEIVSPIYQQVFNLQKMNEKLIQARDLLLPKLMSGEIAV